MKNKVKIVTALLITALCTTSAYAAENLIKNDSFETELLGTNGWRFSGRDGWVYENENSADCTTDEVHSGEKALHFNINVRFIPQIKICQIILSIVTFKFDCMLCPIIIYRYFFRFYWITSRPIL